MHGWVRLEVPWCPGKQIMIAVTWWVCIPPVPPPSGVCLRVSVWPLLTLAWSTRRACLLAGLDVPSSSRVGLSVSASALLADVWRWPCELVYL